jgi:hypothetical protein
MFADPTGTINPTVVKLIRIVLRRLRQTGHFTFSAHELEQWGKVTNKYSLSELFKRDLLGVMAADYFFIVPAFKRKISDGTFTEIAALRERLITPRIPGDKYPPVKGIIFLHERGSHNKLIDDLAGELHRKFPDLVETVRFSKPSDIVRAIRTRTVLTKNISTRRAMIRLASEQRRNTPPGATYFTSKPRKKPI